MAGNLCPLYFFSALSHCVQFTLIVLLFDPHSYDQYADAWDTSVVADIMGEKVGFFHSIKKGVHRVWVDHPSFLAKVWGKTGSKLYGPRSGADYLDNHKRFTLFCKAAIEAVRVLPFGPGEECVFVANDWHSALVPLMLKVGCMRSSHWIGASDFGEMLCDGLVFDEHRWQDIDIWGNVAYMD